MASPRSGFRQPAVHAGARAGTVSQRSGVQEPSEQRWQPGPESAAHSGPASGTGRTGCKRSRSRPVAGSDAGSRGPLQRHLSRPDLTWDDLSRLREWTRLPIVLKGILHPDDAREAAARGMDALIVSNHGGRQIDGSVGALDALPAVVAAAGGLPVLFDSGIRSGADVFRALALGARAVLLGRPYAYGLALAGEAGVREVIQNVLAELDLTLGLAGVPRARDVDMQAVTRR
ncbi:alpha-hydroxy-acid oxidizing protein [Deinococcus sp. KNUC1210]|uniref:alpha-hydroxy-acid oxidizing protein n=1 Tax=Deinococcus sp. KNUC1210 TaxID=2917691 RepID=UPI002107447D|nr:alpha-hydroxy-acid oxidizing protein [Deinococcus sp. KNUC1210]